MRGGKSEGLSEYRWCVCGGVVFGVVDAGLNCGGVAY